MAPPPNPTRCYWFRPSGIRCPNAGSVWLPAVRWPLCPRHARVTTRQKEKFNGTE